MPEYGQFNVIVDMLGAKHEIYSLYGRESDSQKWEKIKNTYSSSDLSLTKEEFSDLENLARAIVENRKKRKSSSDCCVVVSSRLEDNGSTEITITDSEAVLGIARYRRTLEKEEIKELTELITDAKNRNE